jgi:hypothetical protein
MHTWREEVSRHRKNQRIVTNVVLRLQNLLAARAIGSWSRFLGYMRKVRCSASRIVRRMKDMVCARAWSTLVASWSEARKKNAAAAAAAKAALRLGNALVSAAWQGWLGGTRSRRRLHAAMAKVVRRVLNRGQARGFERWKLVVRVGFASAKPLVVSLRATPLLSLACHAGGRLVWATLAPQTRRRAFVALNVWRESRQVLLAGTWTAWRDGARRLCRRRLVLLRAADRRSRVRYCRCFGEWCDQRAWAEEARRTEARLVGLVGKWLRAGAKSLAASGGALTWACRHAAQTLEGRCVRMHQPRLGPGPCGSLVLRPDGRLA